MKKRIDKYQLIAVLILIIIVLAVLTVVSLVGGAIMHFFGFEYKSLGSILLFFLIPTVICFPISSIIEMLPGVLYFEFSVLTKRQAMVFYVIIDTLASMLAFSITDYYMDSVRANDIAIFVISFLFALFGVKDVVSEEENANFRQKMK